MNEARLEATDHVEIGGEALLATGGMTRPGAARADYSEVVLVRRRRDALARMTGAVHSSKRWPRTHAPGVSLRRIGECLKHMIALGGVMAFKSSGW